MVKRQKSHYITRKGSTYQEAIAIINIYVPDIGTLKYIKQKLTELKRETNIVQSDLRTLLPHSQQW